jgi:plastocyanin
MRLQRTLFVVLALLVGFACGRSPAAPSADGSASSLAAMSGPSEARPSVAVPAVQRPEEVRVNMTDACDQATFDAVLGAGTCIRAGGVKFNQFIAELTRLGFVGPWHFAPRVANVTVGQTFAAINQGGETHTFTEVADFGGGIVPLLNNLAHVPTVAPECAALEEDDFVAPGATYKESVDHAGAHKYQCCIHPWMRLEAQATSR